MDAGTPEGMMDELAYAARLDPYEFRKRNISHKRWLGVLEAVTDAAKWTPRVAASKLSSARVVTGRGIGLGDPHKLWLCGRLRLLLDAGRQLFGGDGRTRSFECHDRDIREHDATEEDCDQAQHDALSRPMGKGTIPGPA